MINTCSCVSGLCNLCDWQLYPSELIVPHEDETHKGASSVWRCLEDFPSGCAGSDLTIEFHLLLHLIIFLTGKGVMRVILGSVQTFDHLVCLIAAILHHKPTRAEW